MSWRNLPSVEFGTVGEYIVEDALKKCGWRDVLDKGQDITAVDFVFVNDKKEIQIAEVKTFKAAYSSSWRPFAYSVSSSQFFRNYYPIIEANLGVPFNLYCVDVFAGMVFVADFADLETPTFVSGAGKDNPFYPDNKRIPQTFPFEAVPKWGKARRYYAVQQFKPFFDFRGSSLQEALSKFAEETTFKPVDFDAGDAWLIDAAYIIDGVRELKGT